MIARVLSGLVLVGVAGGVVWAGSTLEGADPAVAAPLTVTTAPDEVAAVCAAPVQLADPDVAGDPEFGSSPVGTTSGVVADAGPGTAALRSLDGAAVTTAAGALTTSVTGPTALWSAPADGLVPSAATAWSVTTDGDLRGLAAAPCQTPTTEQWLVGGGTELGTSTRLVLQNPHGTPATVEIEVWGPTGRLELAGPATFSVPAGGQTSTLLEGLAAEQRRLAVRVSSAGALVTSALQVNSLDGLRPTGVELIPAASAPATRQVVTGLAVEGSAPDGAGASVRVHVPAGDAPAAVDVFLLGPQGRVALPGAETLEVVPGQVAELSLAGLPAGTYTAVLESTVPFLAAGTYPRTDPSSGAVDLAHVPAAAPARAGRIAVPAPAGVSIALAAVPDDVAALPASVVGVGGGPGQPDGSSGADDGADGEADDGADTGADDGATGEEATDAAGKAAPPVPATLTFLGADGAVLETRAVSVTPGVVVAAPGPSGTRAVRLDSEPPAGVTLTWAANLSSGAGLVAALPGTETADVTVSVTVAARADLGLDVRP